MIREDTKGRILLTGLKQVPINSIEDLLNALNFGSSIRQTDSTSINARSSRSHAVFSLNLIQKRSAATPVKDKRRSVPIEAMSGSTENWVTIDSKLHFVDLAGSERLKNTGAQGDRAKEGISINAGLASLGKVISQLSSRQAGSHVSYRDSRLTRLLQDSLGGNAITYMVACINPVEFHLSETLNTVQYAQRARAIQSKPQIQAVSDDSDKQAVIDRLRAEVSFLRDQIRLSERAERRNGVPQERTERQHEREIDLQNQLLDIQENYNALSQRHARLISQIAKAGDDDTNDAPDSLKDVNDSALERLKRSKSFAEAVEKVVLDYETTIQSLEATNSTTRSELATTESNLLEKETKIAYLETVRQQLEARLQKMENREVNAERLMEDLEARTATANSGEEKAKAIIGGLREEIVKMREAEANSEEYISTLEERLAEAEQDQDLMQREIDRLEHVVERQRSIGKLDNLLYELDHIRQTDKAEVEPMPNGTSKRDSENSFRSLNRSDRSRTSSDGAISRREVSPVREHPEHEDAETPMKHGERAPVVIDAIVESQTPVPTSTAEALHVEEKDEPTSPAQSKFVADKLETVTQELFDLRVEHEAAMHDYDELQRKYQLALTAMAEMNQRINEDRERDLDPSRRGSFLADTETQKPGEDGKPTISRTLSSELSSLGESPTGMDQSDVETAQGEEASPGASPGSPLQRETQLAQEMAKLKSMNEEREQHMAELTESYEQLQEKHQDTLDYVEELKAEVQKAQMTERESPASPVLRRKTSQNISATDRATRSFASLRNMALENFESEPDKLQSFEVNLNAAMTELHLRSDRVNMLEAEAASLRKEMELKMTIISGLTRERSSFQTSAALDVSGISSMRDQLLESENRIRNLSKEHAVRERELLQQIDSLQATLSSTTDGAEDVKVPGEFPEIPAQDTSAKELTGEPNTEHQRRVSQLQQEVKDWRSKHDSVLESMKASEKQLLATISDLEVSLRHAEQQSNASRAVSPEEKSDSVAAPEEVALERKRHAEAITALQREVEVHKSTASSTATRLFELEQAYNNILLQVDADSRSRELTEKELETHRELVFNLESQLEEQKHAMTTHIQALDSLQDSHSKDIERVNAASIAAQAEASEKLERALAHHKDAMASLQNQLENSRAEYEASTTALQAEVTLAKNQLKELIEGAGLILNKPTNANNLTSHLQTIINSRKDILALHETATNELRSVRQELESARSDAADFERKFEQLKVINDETIKELELISEKERKSSRLVEELEEQLNSNFDQNQAAQNRFSALQTERQVLLIETQKELEESRNKIIALEVSIQDLLHKQHLANKRQAQLSTANRLSSRESLDPRDAELQRSNSGNSGQQGLRKSVSAVSLPSPPPAIPLPPLPGSTPSPNNAPSPPTSRHQSKDIAQAQLFEDQEARIRTIEKHLFAEKQLTATLEEALTDLESSSTKMKSEMEAWRRKCTALEEELANARKERQSSRLSVQQLEEERKARQRTEEEYKRLAARMQVLDKSKKKKSSINCF
jgi:chromosome segregation ATPase